jgi:uncharacterized protein (DUF305 family)
MNQTGWTRSPRHRAYALLILLLVLGPLAAAGPHGHDEMAQPSGQEAQTPFGAMLASAMKAMDEGMRRAPMTGDPDRDFAAMMIPHHQGAIDMAKAELLYGKNPILRRLAQEIIIAQNSEIEILQRELQHPTTGGSVPR